MGFATVCATAGAPRGHPGEAERWNYHTFVRAPRGTPLAAASRGPEAQLPLQARAWHAPPTGQVHSQQARALREVRWRHQSWGAGMHDNVCTLHGKAKVRRYAPTPLPALLRAGRAMEFGARSVHAVSSVRTLPPRAWSVGPLRLECASSAARSCARAHQR